ncbi:putative serine threonine protein kinase [Rosellinia necatrix]|uniref:non-specific serine/threonine protein kinase n=1 Tax=Rosellinia necatrix TaxID=77044 RepID=A0A1W2TGK7_ROSNE|nr:putative serine threonine protein kinase [Rosellinia necatrix]
MADRGYNKTRIHRAPLGDATDRVINTSPQKPGKQDRPPNPAPNPLRAHPVGVVPNKAPPRKCTDSPSDSAAADIKGYAIPEKAQHAPAVRATVPGADAACVDNRFSQISTSSGASSGKRKTHIGPWQLGRTLGKGSAARVRLARHQTTQDVVAVKILAKNMTQLAAAGSMAELDKWDRTRDEFNSQRHMPLSIEREVAVLKLIDHPHIVKLHDIWENRSEIYLILEYMDRGDMFSYINMYGPLPEFEMVGYFRQLLAALEYVHSFNICHRDLKPENILMKSNGLVKIADFGMAAIQQSPTHALRTSCGSPHYAAPELIARARYRGEKVDVWSMGCLLFVALSRQLPFDDPDGNVPRLLAKAQRGVYQVPAFFSKEARDLIAKMLTVDPSKRITTRKIWQHPLIRKYDGLDDLNDGGQVLNSRMNDRSKPVRPEELDMQILRQLKSMWHTFSEKQISMQLINTQPNDQKLFYWLLLNYREKKLENYDTDLACSPSDYHHLRPPNWKKKFTTAEFPSRHGRTPSRFTVISTVPTDGSIDESDNVTEGGATILSYDPYKSSRIMENAYASHAKIMVYRNGSTANNSTRSSTSHRGQGGSFRSTSNRSRQAKSGRRITAPAAMRASRQSLSSIQSGESTLYTRPVPKPKRGVNFSYARIQSGTQREEARAETNTAKNDALYNHGCASSLQSSRSVQDNKVPESSDERSRMGTKSMINASRVVQDTPYWNEEVREFSHSIARDCDDAFNSTLLDPKPCLGNRASEASSLGASGTADETLLSSRLTTLTPTPGKHVSIDPRPWDRRPLPPTPSTTASTRDELMMAKKRNGEEPEHCKSSAHTKLGVFELSGAVQARGLMGEDEVNRRISSAPIYSQYSTQWGKGKIPLPSIDEKAKEEARGNVSDKHRIVSAPVWYAKTGSVQMDDHTALEYLSRHNNTIRLVNSPSSKPYTESRVPQPHDSHQDISRGSVTYSQPNQQLNLRQRYKNDEPVSYAPDTQEDPLEDFTSSIAIKKKSSWFKRASKDREDVTNTRESLIPNRTDRLTCTSTNSSEDPTNNQPITKKSFNIAFWRNSKRQAQMQISQTGKLEYAMIKYELVLMKDIGSETDGMPDLKRTRVFRHSAGPSNDCGDQAATRNIEPQQNWLARLFRVKPATRYLCFIISRHRARQETAILLREWRKYGIRDVEVDKERNIVFARLGQPNCKSSPVGSVV